MKVIKKKIWAKYFDLMSSGKKKYEFRLNDFDIEVGDILRLEEWDPDSRIYTGRFIEKKVTYVSDFKLNELTWSKEEYEQKGFKLLSLE